MRMRVLNKDHDRWFVRSAMLAVAGALIVGVSIGLNLLTPGERVTPPPAGPEIESSAPATTATGPVVPSFDVVRVTPSGDAVIAGRGSAGASVSVRSGEQVLGTVTADAHGEWVLVPEQPLPAGSHRLFAEVVEGGALARRSVEDILIVVPERPLRAEDTGPPPLVLKMLPDGSSSLLVAAPSGTGAGSLAIERLDQDDTGRTELAGRAEAGARVRLRLDGRALGEVQAGADGVWRLELPRPLPAGTSMLAAEQLDRRGAVVRRTEVAVALPAERMSVDGDRVLVQAGDNLWEIAREVYGRGTAFAMIFEANRAQIEDPDRIYPGQRFQLPASSPGPTAAGRP